ncbi:uncharacterized protein LOC127454710 [Myxocyprinus asiaticus]|uniref:uncharacterized protein LOC127454710 n=1 Tax=Myxocyprinus asiaticus TaxID=70543 RepID=UPI002223C751|nr:uncharacterized protein LOC127454710 [Myxocyprinus asiaticus]
MERVMRLFQLMCVTYYAQVSAIKSYANVNDIVQSPTLFLQLKETAKLTCSHTKGATYNRMYWFLQYHGETMEFIVYTTSFGTVEYGKLNKTKDLVTHGAAEKGSLTRKSSIAYSFLALALCAVITQLSTVIRLNMRQFIIRETLITIIFSLFRSKGFTQSDKVLQMPRDMIVNLKDSPKLQCSHSISNYNRILWYKQTQDKQLLLLGYLTGSQPQLEPEFTNKFDLKGDGNSKGTFTIERLQSNDTATYFCAASTQC